MSARRRPRQAPARARSTAAGPGDLPAWVVYLLLIGLTFAAYVPLFTSSGGWLWDDEGHVTKAALQTVAGLQRIWFDIGATQQYYPVVHSAFWIESHLFGTDNPMPYHAVSVLLHASSAFLLFRILRALDLPGAITAALIFALHPVHVESVAWTSELKNTLSCVFFLGAALTYLRFESNRAARTLILSLVLFLFAVLSKSVTATLPVAILVVVWWRRGGLEWRRDVLPLIPMVVAGIAAGLTTVWFERTLIGAEGAEFQFSFVERALIAGRALWFYAVSLIWPVGLSFNYVRWDVSQGVWWQYLFPLGVIAVLACLWLMRYRGVLAGVLVFSLVLGPALGFVNVYPFRFSFVADHFQYHASVGLIALMAVGLSRIVTLRQAGPSSIRLGMIALAATLLAFTLPVAARYVDGPTLYRATIRQNPDSWLAHNNLAALYLTGPSPNLQAAVTHARAALALFPQYAEARYNLAVALDDLGDTAAAIQEYRTLLDQLGEQADFRRRRASTSGRLGFALARTGRTAEAIVYLREAARLDQANPQTFVNLGGALLQQNQIREAQEALEQAVRLDPSMVDAHYNLGAAYLMGGRPLDAVRSYEAAIRLRPGDPQSLAALARAKQMAGIR
jgi:tetratricopeptide (TPR) repeat protein